jgi:hypothetical protein
VSGQAAVFDSIGENIHPLPGGTESWVQDISGGGSFAAGGSSTGGWLLWDLRDLPAVEFAELTTLEPDEGHPEAYGINDYGIAVGQVLPSGPVIQFAAIWEPDDNGGWGPARRLPELAGHDNSFAVGINNAGHIVGWNSVRSEHGHAVLWIPIPETDPREYNIVDLTPDEPRWAGARFVMEPALDGRVQVFGSHSIDGQTRATVWTVDVANRTVLTDLTERAPESGIVEDIYAGEEGLEVLLGSGVWNVADNVVHELPLSGSGCGGQGAAFDSSGKIFGRALFNTSKKTICRFNSKDVIQLPVVWTKIVPVP